MKYIKFYLFVYYRKKVIKTYFGGEEQATPDFNKKVNIKIHEVMKSDFAIGIGILSLIIGILGIIL